MTLREALATALRDMYRLDHPQATMADWQSDADWLLERPAMQPIAAAVALAEAIDVLPRATTWTLRYDAATFRITLTFPGGVEYESEFGQPLAEFLIGLNEAATAIVDADAALASRDPEADR